MRRLVVIAILLGGSLYSCELDGTKPCSEEKGAAAIISEFPDSIKVGDKVDLDIGFVLESSCGEFDRFETSATENSIKVKIITKYEGCNCDLSYTESSESYELGLDYPGVYEYKFWLADGDYDSRSITVFE